MTDENHPDIPLINGRAMLSIKEFCIAANQCRSKTYEEIKSGELKSVRFGRSRRIPASEVVRRVRKAEAA